MLTVHMYRGQLYLISISICFFILIVATKLYKISLYSYEVISVDFITFRDYRFIQASGHNPSGNSISCRKALFKNISLVYFSLTKSMASAGTLVIT